jgi:aminoglycoside phosphotransferase (APT) family kinase protein
MSIIHQTLPSTARLTLGATRRYAGRQLRRWPRDGRGFLKNLDQQKPSIDTNHHEIFIWLVVKKKQHMKNI